MKFFETEKFYTPKTLKGQLSVGDKGFGDMQIKMLIGKKSIDLGGELRIYTLNFMRKLFAIVWLLLGVLAICVPGRSALGALDPHFTVDTNVAVKTERVSHGCRSCSEAFFAAAQVGYKVRESVKLSAGTEAIVSFDGKYSRVSPCVSFTWDMTEMFTLDSGYTHYFYTSARDGGQKGSNEIYAGIAANVLLKPAFYTFYDFDNQDFSAEVSVGHKFDLQQCLRGLELEVSAKIGVEAVKKAGGVAIEGEKKDFFYYGTGAGLVYAFNDNARVKVGISYEGNSAKKNSWVNGSHRDFLWGSASINCSF
ncbi:MAG: hypothetical protein LBI56_01420 [Puniceicoccales bacterium]|jgi:hypothetical protein|nr:hypothetical protein [Puniceicoccales bacterium]